ncbi:hypothetical protein [Streptomyces antimycoticus]
MHDDGRAAEDLLDRAGGELQAAVDLSASLVSSLLVTGEIGSFSGTQGYPKGSRIRACATDLATTGCRHRTRRRTAGKNQGKRPSVATVYRILAEDADSTE